MSDHLGKGHLARSDRRGFLKRMGLGAAVGLAGGASSRAQVAKSGLDEPTAHPRRTSIGVSTYSFWQFRGRRLDIVDCIDKAAAMGFDGVEVLHIQMADDSNATLQKIKRRAHSLGLALMGFSTHQGFVTPDLKDRQANVQKTLHQIDVAYRLGIPTMRINTGRWGTTRSFDELMTHKGIEPALPGHNDEEALKWVIDSLEKLLPRARNAESCSGWRTTGASVARPKAC